MSTSTELERESTGRDQTGRFTSGPANTGRPRGSRNRHNAAVLAAIGDLSGRAVDVLRQKLDQGDAKVAMFIVARFTPAERAVALGTSDPMAIADLVAEGHATPTEGSKLALMTKTLREAHSVDEMRARLDEIEALLVSQRRG